MQAGIHTGAEEGVGIYREMKCIREKPLVLHWDKRNMFSQGQHTEADVNSSKEFRLNLQLEGRT